MFSIEFESCNYHILTLLNRFYAKTINVTVIDISILWLEYGKEDLEKENSGTKNLPFA